MADTRSAPEAGTLNHLRALKPGWNSYGAPAIDERAIRAAEAILRTPGQAVPTVHGGVQIEWHCDGVDAEFELGPDGQQVFEETRAEEVQRLKRELADARRDSARLDWFLVSEARDFGAFCSASNAGARTSNLSRGFCMRCVRHRPHWRLNGIPLAEFRGLPESSIRTLKHKGDYWSVEIFSSESLPPGDLELWWGRQRVAIIRGLGRRPSAELPPKAQEIKW